MIQFNRSSIGGIHENRSSEIRKRANRIFFRKLVLNIVLLVAASFLLSAVLSQTRAAESRKRYEASASAVLDDIAENWQIRKDYADNITRIYLIGKKTPSIVDKLGWG